MHPSLLPSLLPWLALGVVLAAAVWHDVKSRRIPNSLIVAGMLAAMAIHSLLPAVPGLFGQRAGGLGALASVGGLASGLLLLMPFYALRTMGAGDVKLMGVVGAFLGPVGAFNAALFALLAGGLLALAVAWHCGQLLQVYVNVQQMLGGARRGRANGRAPAIPAPVVVTGKLPYAIAIACGAVAEVLHASGAVARLMS